MKTTIYKRMMGCLLAAILFLAVWSFEVVKAQGLVEIDFGDAPEEAIAYPSKGVQGMFPTCINSGLPGSFIRHGFIQDVGGGYFGFYKDTEFDGNANGCPDFPPYDNDECFGDDAGLITPGAYTIIENYLTGGLAVTTCPASPGGSIGVACETAYWGSNIDIFLNSFTTEPGNNWPNTGYVNVLIDWDQSGAWGGSSTSCNGNSVPEHVLVNFPVYNFFQGSLSILSPPSFTIGPNTGFVWARFSFTEVPVPLPWTGAGEFDLGETEDYLLFVGGTDLGDAPAPYPTTLANNGAMHHISTLYLGLDWPDHEPDGQPDPLALGDDLNGIDDEEDVIFVDPFVPGSTTQVHIHVGGDFTGNPVMGFVNAWIDWNKNGSWADMEEHVIIDFTVNDGSNIVLVNVPPYATPGNTFARFRLTSVPGLSYTGVAPDGEVEDYLIVIDGPDVFDFGDAPEGAPAYAGLGVVGQFPTCIGVGPSGYVQHSPGGAFFGLMADQEPDGNAGLCPSFTPGLYNQDECYGDGDAGLMVPASYTIIGPPGAETVVLCPGSPPMPLGMVCSPALWGPNIDIHLQNISINQAICYVNVLIDWNQDGVWGGTYSCGPGMPIAPEHALVNFPVPNGFIGPLSALMPPPIMVGPNAGYVWARFAISEQQVPQNWDGSGIFDNGETEDYLFMTEGYLFDWGDAPDQPYPTLATNNGAHHFIDGISFLGLQADGESDGQSCPNALGDDSDGNDDEDGVTFNSGLLIGQPATVTVVASVPGYLNAWIDFNRNGFWGDPIEHVFFDMPLVAGPNVLNFIVPPVSLPGQSFARFRFASSQGLTFTGYASDGEVEDYEVFISDETPVELDFGDTPDPYYPTLLMNDGARHIIDYNVYLGNSIDPDPDGQPDPNALGDDNDGNNDEDGVLLPSTLIPGQPVTIIVTASTPGFFNGWIDFDANGSWAEPNEHIFSDCTLMPGGNILNFVVPQPAVPGFSFARFRFSTYQGLSYTGQAPDGEVEDYLVIIEEPVIVLDLKLFLEGPFNGTDMNTDLNLGNVIPLSQPYGSDPLATWYYTGTEQVAAIPNADVVDWILVELRDATTAGGADKSTMIAQQACFLTKSGNVVALDGINFPIFPVTVTHNLYAVIYHRNHLGIMSAYPIIPTGNLYTYDYSIDAGQVYGNVNGHKHLGGGIWGLVGGDGKSDGQINNGDKNDIWRVQAGSSGYKEGDFSMDVQVNNGDKNDNWVPNVGKGSLIP
ncbi:MAG: hypothetical protein JXA03_06015 [Bacteroidales bacterium]|nr:hypothetical protein [Bacteroidales bacterium]